MKTSFTPGEVWTDTQGFRIQAHGGSIFYENGKYYWYGENKEKTLTGTRIWHYGVKMYSSADLYNWQDEGIILQPVMGEFHPLNPTLIMDRPHIVYNKKTRKYVMWMKLAGTEQEPDNFDISTAGIAVADRLTGPYTFIKSIAPKGETRFGDFDVFVDEDGTAYCVYERPHTEMVVATLTEDYTDFSGEYSSHMFFKNPPFIREAPCVFKRNGYYYMLTSGTTGYYPNPTMCAHAKSMHGPWEMQGLTCVNDKNRNSFHAQFSSVFSVHGTQLLIATGDRWLSDLPEKMPDVEAVFDSWFNPEKEPIMTGEELNSHTALNTSLADYVWLPLSFTGGENGAPEKVSISFLKEWKTEDFTK